MGQYVIHAPVPAGLRCNSGRDGMPSSFSGAVSATSHRQAGVACSALSLTSLISARHGDAHHVA